MYAQYFIQKGSFLYLLAKGKNIHRGALLEEAVRNSSVKISQLVKRMGISRGTYYNHIADPNLSLDQLNEYGQELRHDFSEALPQLKRLVLEDEKIPYNPPKTMEEALVQRDFWRDRFYLLMERYNKLLEAAGGE